MTITLKDLEPILWKYFRPLWIDRLGLPEDISDDDLRLLIKLWNEVNPPEEP